MPTTRSQSLGRRQESRSTSPIDPRDLQPGSFQQSNDQQQPINSQTLLELITQRFQEQQLQIEGLCNQIATIALPPNLSRNPLIITSTPNKKTGEEDEDDESDHDNQELSKSKDKDSSHRRHHHGKRNIARFSGNDATLHIDSWLRIFEVVMFDKDDNEKKYEVAQYIDGDALTWFANHLIPIIKQTSWKEIKAALIQRFKVQEVRPLIAAQDRYLTRGESVQKYYDDKMRLLQQTNLHDIDMVGMLNRGMPSYYKPHLICAFIPTPAKWLATTLELEATFKRNQVYNAKRNSQENKTMTAIDSKKKSEKKPNECRICLKKGIKNQLHWHNDCPNRDPNWVSPKKKEQRENSAAVQEN